MASRAVVVVLGLIAGIATLAVLVTRWSAALTFAGDAAGISSGGIWAQTAWTISIPIIVSAVVSLICAVATGVVETSRTRRAIDDFRLDPSQAGLWNVADWRSAFAHTAVAERAEAVVATVGATGSSRMAVDTALLVGLDDVWLERLTLQRVISPLPPLLLGAGALLALMAAANRMPWLAALAAGIAGWLAISLTQYLARMALMRAVVTTVDAATAALRPMTAIRAAADGKPNAAAETDMAIAVARALAEPISQLAESARALAAAARPVDRDQAIQSALAELREGIERLLDLNGG